MVNRALAALGFILAANALAAERLPDGFPLRRGPLVFTVTSALLDPAPEGLRWLSRFDLILTNGYDLAPEAVRLSLQQAGSRLFLYVWSNGFTAKEAAAQLPQSQGWREVLESHPDWLLNLEPQEGPPGTPPAHFFDLSQAALRDWLAVRLTAWRAQTGYDGFFFDLAGSTALPEQTRAQWQRLHPEVPYDQAFLELLRAVRQADPGALLLTNQACGTLPAALALVDTDLTESYATSYLWGPEETLEDRTLTETFVRPWRGVAGLEALYGAIQAKLQAAPPRRGFVYLDYMRPRYLPPPAPGEEWGTALDLEAVYYSYAAARLWGQEAFCSGWYAGREYDGPLYFADLGRPRGQLPQEVTGLVLREYERGWVALLAEPEAAETDLALAPAGEGLYDLYSGRTIPVREGRARIRLEPYRSPLTATLQPSGRVFLRTTP